MEHLVVLHYCRDTEIAKHELGVLTVAEKEITRFNVLMDNPHVMTVFQCGSRLQGYSAELVHVTVELVFVEGASLEIFHKFVVAIDAIDIHFSEVISSYYHLKVDSRNKFHQLLLYLELGIIYFQHEFLFILLDKKHLTLTGIVAEGLKFCVLFATNEERLCGCTAIARFICSGHNRCC